MPQQKIELQDIDRIFINRGTIHFIGYDNILYGIGRNGYAQLGLGTNKKPKNKWKIREINTFSDNKSCALMSTGSYNDHVFIYTVNNELYGFGANDSGQLGCGGIYNKRIDPILINIPFKIKCISNGFSHSIFVSEAGKVYGSGDNGSGQLGIIDQDSIIICEIVPLDSNYFNGEIPIKSICGHQYSSILTDKGNVYSFGGNNRGALGIGEATLARIPTKIDYFERNNIYVNNIVSGGFHSTALTNNGNVYVYGCNAFGQCGINDINVDIIFIPKEKLPISTPVNVTSLGTKTTILKDINDDFIILGKNSLLNDNKHQTITHISKESLLNELNNPSKNCEINIHCLKERSLIIIEYK